MLLPLFAHPALAQDAADPADAKTLEELNHQWSRLTPEQQEEMQKLYDERVKVLKKEERRKQREAWEKLREMDPAEREELRRKLEEVKKRKDLEELKRKRRKAHGIEKKFLEDLPAELRTQIDLLPKAKRKELVRYSFRRMLKLAIESFIASLTEEERRKLNRHHGPGWFKAMYEIEKERALAAIPDEERARIAALPKPERRKAEFEAVHREREKRAPEIRKQLAAEIRDLLSLSPEAWDLQMALPRLKHLLRHLKIHDREIMEALDKLSPEKLAELLEQARKIDRIEDREQRRRAIKGLKARLTR